MYDAIISCPYGYNQGMAEWVANGFEHLLRNDELGNIIGIAKEFNPLYPSATDFDAPSLVYLRGDESIMIPLIAATWTKSKLLVYCNPEGEWVNYGTEESPNMVFEDVWVKLKNNAAALAEYKTYPAGQVPEFLDDGVTPNPQFAETITVDIEGVPTVVENPQYEPFRMIGCFT